VRALSVACTLVDQAHAWRHDTYLGNRLTDHAVGLLGHDALLTTALTIINQLIRSAVTSHTAKLCDGRWTLTWLPAHVLTKGQAATDTAHAASNIPASSVFAASAATMQAPEVPGAH